MESTQNLKKRIKSVANINKITKAMELVAATKMRRAQEVTLASRPYAFVALDLLANLTLLEKSKNLQMPELLRERKVYPIKSAAQGAAVSSKAGQFDRVKKVLFVLVASDKGLAGSFNSSVFKKFEQHIERDKEKYKDEEHLYVVVGEKAFQYLSKKFRTMDSSTVLRKFVQAGDYSTPEEVQPINDFIVEGYLAKKWDRVVVVSMHFRSALRQEPHVRRILPVDFDHIKEIVQEIIPVTGKFAELIKEHNMSFVKDEGLKIKDYLIEPSPKVVLEDLAKHLLFMQIYHLILEANAAEHSARRTAMKTASDNASELGENLNLQYNKSRQAAITKEIIEITAGAESLS